jgi:hypothetical protein
MSGERDLASVRRNITGWTEYDGVDGNASGDGVGNGVSPNTHVLMNSPTKCPPSPKKPLLHLHLPTRP